MTYCAPMPLATLAKALTSRPSANALMSVAGLPFGSVHVSPKWPSW